MEKKQTTVEWLEDKISTATNDELTDNIAAWFNSAKIMEKEQIENAYWDGGQDVPMISKQCEQYYNETYGGQDE